MKPTYLLAVITLIFSACNFPNENQPENNKKQTDMKSNAIELPEIKVIDTDFSKGRLGLEHTINLTDLEKFHGHLCDGLVVGFLGLNEGLKQLYPNGVVDRTNTRIVSKSSPCLTDAAVYVTGGRYQFNTFYVDNTIEDGFYIIQRIDNGKAVKINLKQGVKPSIIDEMGKKAVAGELPTCELDKLKKLEDDFSQHLLTTNPADNFIVTEVNNFDWQPVLKNDFVKTDILNKNKPKCNN
jgi:acetolactate decarboxylase